MKKPKILIILGTFGFGGAENMVCELIKNIDFNKYNVSVLCTHSKNDIGLTQRVEEMCPVTFLNQDQKIGPKQIIKVMGAIGKLKPDLIHAHMGSSGFAAIWSLVCRNPVLITIHTKPEKEFSKKIEMLIRAALRFGKTKLVAVSEENLTRVKAYYGVDEHKAKCVNNGIDTNRFTRKKHSAFTLINVARHDENKNQAALIRCFARMHREDANTRLLLLGDGDTHQNLVRLVDELGLSDAVEFTGNIPNTEDYYAVSDVYVQCSHVEAMPISVLEAMAAGLPIVATDVGGLRDVVKDNGILVADNDEEALYQAILSIYKQDEKKSKAMCEESQRIVQDYSSERMAQKYEKIYQEML